MRAGLAGEAQAVLRLPGESYRAFSTLPQPHPADVDEVAFHVHALARIVATRATHRAHPDLYRTSPARRSNACPRRPSKR